MKFWIFLSICLPFNLLACSIDSPEIALSSDKLNSLMKHLDTNNSEINSLTPIWKISAFGYGEKPHYVELDSKPIDTEFGYGTYSRIGCSYSHGWWGDKWECDPVSTRRNYTRLETMDYFDLYEGVSANDAQKIIHLISKDIIVDESNHYKYVYFGEEKISDEPLDIVLIAIDGNGNYFTRINSKEPCSIHSIVLAPIKCDSQTCGFNIIENEYFFVP